MGEVEEVLCTFMKTVSQHITFLDLVGLRKGFFVIGMLVKKMTLNKKTDGSVEILFTPSYRC